MPPINVPIFNPINILNALIIVSIFLDTNLIPFSTLLKAPANLSPTVLANSFNCLSFALKLPTKAITCSFTPANKGCAAACLNLK